MNNLLFTLLAMTVVGTASANGGPASTMKPEFNKQQATMPCPMNMGNGPGMGNGRMYGRGYGNGRWMSFDQDNARGWQLMTDEERIGFQTQMRSVQTYDECKTIQSNHRAIMETRAKEKGVTLMTPRRDVCSDLWSNNVIK